jgi:hypothetical protein
VTSARVGGNVSGKEFFAEVAQLVEQGAENARVVGAIPTLGTILMETTKVFCVVDDIVYVPLAE